MPRPATFDHLKSRKRPATRTVDVVLDPELARAIRKAETTLEDAERKLALRPENADVASAQWAAQEELEALRARAVADDAVVSMRFRGIGRLAWDQLVADHPATDDQTREAKRSGAGDLSFNIETFPPALVAASLEEPNLSMAEVLEIWDDPNWNQAELMDLFNAALECNTGRIRVDLGKGSGTTSPTAKKSAGALNTASPTASS